MEKAYEMSSKYHLAMGINHSLISTGTGHTDQATQQLAMIGRYVCSGGSQGSATNDELRFLEPDRF